MVAKISDVAKEAQVAPSTVSNVLNNTKFVSENVREKVLSACDKLKYVPNFIASSMKSNRTNIIGLFLKSSASGFSDIYFPIIEGVTLAATKLDYNIILYYDIDKRESLRKILTSGRGPIDGAIMLTPQKSDFRIYELKEQKINYVLIGKPFEDSTGISFVDVRNDKIVFNSVKLLFEKGRRKILFLNSEEDLAISKDRQSGFDKAIKLFESDVTIIRNIKTDIESAKNTCQELLKVYDFDGIIVESDISAQGVYAALNFLGKVVGKDVSVIALGGEGVTTIKPKVATHHINYLKIGIKAVECLVKKIRNEPVNEENYIETAYISGESV